MDSLLALDSNAWKRLDHAYGSAGDIPAMIRDLESVEGRLVESDIWGDICAAVLHQGDIHSAAFATIPHVLARARDERDFHIAADTMAYLEAFDGDPPAVARAGYDEALTEVKAYYRGRTRPCDGLRDCWRHLFGLAGSHGWGAAAELFDSALDESDAKLCCPGCHNDIELSLRGELEAWARRQKTSDELLNEDSARITRRIEREYEDFDEDAEEEVDDLMSMFGEPAGYHDPWEDEEEDEDEWDSFDPLVSEPEEASRVAADIEQLPPPEPIERWDGSLDDLLGHALYWARDLDEVADVLRRLHARVSCPLCSRTTELVRMERVVR